MLIKNITLNNFRQYKGKQKINFSVDPQKNVTVIIGENGSGKTTLLESFLWCFYNRLNLPNKNRLLNTDLCNKLDKGDTSEVFVEINLEHNQNEYIMKRSAMYRKMDDEVDRISRNLDIKFKNNDGTLTKLKNDEINNILPDDLSTYFFFDGERIENLSKSNRKGKKDISDAVKNILGLDILLNAQKHLGKLMKKFEEQYDQDNSKEMKSLKKELKNYRNEYNKYKKLLNANQENIEVVNEKIQKLNEKIKANASEGKLQKIREEKEKRIKQLEEDIISLKKDIEKNNKESLPEFMVSKLLNLFSEKFDLSNIQSKGIAGIDGSAIQALINRGKCICGQDIIPGSKYHQNLSDQKKYQPPASLGTIIVQFNEKTDDVKRKGSSFVKTFEDKYYQIESKNDIIENLENEIKNISKKLKGAEDVKELEIKREQHKNELDTLHHKRTEYLSELKKDQEKIEEKETELDKLALSSDKNNKIAVRKKYTSKIRGKISDYYIKKEKGTRKELNEEVCSIFKKLIETNHNIILNDDYTFKVVDIDGEDSTSQGQDVITSFAFIGGLINLAKEKHESIEVAEPYPLIMDAPFAKLSKAHRNNVATILPDIVEQFILFTVDSQYEGDIKNAIMPRIGKKYELEMSIENEKYTKVVRGDI